MSQGDELLAVGSLLFDPVHTQKWYLENLAVVPEHRNKGYSRQLLPHLEHRATELGASQLRLTGPPVMRPSSMYGKRGYELVDRGLGQMEKNL